MRRTKEDAEQTRHDLLKAAEHVFSKQGFAATRLSDIAKEAGVTRGAIYHHFGNKMELFIALHKERVDPYFKLVKSIFDSDLSPRTKITKLMSELVVRAKNDIDFAASQRFGIFRDMELHDCEEIHKFMREQGEQFFLILVNIIKEGQAIGEIRRDIDPQKAAFNTIAYVKGITSIMVMERQTANLNIYNEDLIETALKGF